MYYWVLAVKNPTSLWVCRVTKFSTTFWIHRSCAFFCAQDSARGESPTISQEKLSLNMWVKLYSTRFRTDKGVMGNYYCPPVESLSFRCSYVAGKSTVTISFCSALLCRLAPTTQWFYQQCAVFLPKFSAIFACKPWWKEYIFIFPWNFWRLIHYLDMG